MRLLVDTHVLLWWLEDHPRLGDKARSILEAAENDAHVSIVSFWEIALKVRIGKLRADLGLIAATLGARGVKRLGIEDAHLIALVDLPTYQCDPFDHLLAAQAMVEKLTLVTGDRELGRYPIEVIAAGR